MRKNSEQRLARLGIVLCVASAAFATIMITDQNRAPTISGSEHLLIFARPTTSPRPKSEIAVNAPRPASLNGTTEFDTTPIGTIRDLKASVSNSDANKNLIKDHFVRSIFGTKALIQSPKGLLVVEAGSDIPGIGVVLAIEVRGRESVVATNNGVIAAVGSSLQGK